MGSVSLNLLRPRKPHRQHPLPPILTRDGGMNTCSFQPMGKHQEMGLNHQVWYSHSRDAT